MTLVVVPQSVSASGGKSSLRQASPAGPSCPRVPPRQGPYRAGCREETGCVMERLRAGASVAHGPSSPRHRSWSQRPSRVPQQGRQPQPQRSRGRLGGLCRGAEPQPAAKGTCVDVGAPAASATADTLDRYRRDTRAPRQSLVTSRRPSDGRSVLGAWESHVQGEGGRSAGPWHGPHGPSTVRGAMLDTAPGRPPPVAPALDRIPAKARSEPPRTFPSCAHPLPRDRRRLSAPWQDQGHGRRWTPRRRGHAHLDWGAQEGRRQRRPRVSAAARAERVETPTGQSRTAPARAAPV